MRLSRASILVLSLPAVAVMFPYSMNAAVRVTNYSFAQNQAQQDLARTNSVVTMAPQPARVLTDNSGNTLSISQEQMDACNSIYPNGKFDWVKPTTGNKKGSDATCAALVEMRSYKDGGTQYTVLASAYLAAGDSIKCNIDNFDNITPMGMDFTYPADNPPTREEVAKVMAQENKANAGFKILGAALVGGIGGNLLGQGNSSDDMGLGTSGNKLKTTAIGAAGAAALMTASTQINDYKTSSVVLSTGLNTAAGAVAGNVLGSGDDVLKISDCKLNEGSGTNATSRQATCLYGTLDVSGQDATTVDENIFFDTENRRVYECIKDKDAEKWKDCRTISLTDISFYNSDKSYSSMIEITADEAVKLRNGNDKYGFTSDGKTLQKGGTDAKWVKIKSAKKAGRRTGAMVDVTGRLKDNMFGYKYSDWSKGKDVKSQLAGAYIYDMRGNRIENASLDNFYPNELSADDSVGVDFSNKARTTSTLIGAGGGAALGALSGASGADLAIDERWQAAVREYGDSLKNIMCVSGDRFLDSYNSIIIIPNMKEQ